MIIYRLRNKINGKIYIGKTVKTLKNRILRHYHQTACCQIHRALRKYGIENFDAIEIDSAETDTELSEKEKYWIKIYNCKKPNGYNMTDGGEGVPGCYPNEKTRLKLSEAAKGNKKFLGKKHSDEAKRKISIAHIGNKGRLGKPHSDKTKKLIGLSHSGDKSSSAKLTWDIVKEIRYEYSTGGYTQQELADKYGITLGTVNPLIHYRTWKEYA